MNRSSVALLDSSETVLGVWAPLSLVITAISLIYSPTAAVFNAGAAIGTVLGVITTYLLIIEAAPGTRILWMLASGYLLGYPGGTLNTYFHLLKKDSSVADYFGRSQEDLSFALAIVLLACALLFVVGAFFEKPLRIETGRLRASDMFFVYAGICLIIFEFATGNIGFMGVANSVDDNSVNPLAEMAGLISPVLPGFTLFLVRTVETRLPRVAVGGLLAIECLLLLPQGRRVLIYAIVIILLCLRLSGFSFKFAMWKKVVIVGSLAISLYFANVVFYSMRYVKNQTSSPETRVSLLDLSQGAWKFLSDGRDAQFDEELSSNLETRTFILMYFSDLLSASWTHPPLMGRDLLYSAAMAIPSALYPDKVYIRFIPMEESAANPQFGLPVEDDANSLLTTGVSDFGLVGVFAYAVVFGLLITYMIRVASWKAPDSVKLLVLMIAVFNVLQAEIAAPAYFSLCRDILILAFIFGGVTKLRSFVNPFLHRAEPAKVRFS